MVITDVTVDVVKNYLRVDTDSDDVLIEAILSASIKYAENITGLSVEQLAEYNDIPLAVLALCADMYDVRQATLTGTQLNPTTYNILNAHAVNLV